jgi:hypothetical protein
LNKVTESLKGKGKDGKDIGLLINDGTYIPVSKFNEVNEAKKVLEADIKTRDNQLNELSEKAKGNEELSKQIKDLTDLNTKNKTEYESKIRDISFNNAVEKALIKENAKYTDILIPKFDKSKLVLNDDGSVVGLDEQIKTLKESYKDLFGTDNPGSSGFNPSSSNNAKEVTLQDAIKDYYTKH